MADWKDKLAIADSATTLRRARRSVNKGVEYVLGKGGFDPAKPLGARSDCSGFVAWALGIPREFPQGSWLQTTSYWQGGHAPGQGLFDPVEAADCRPGDIIVYPDQGRKQGHMGIVTQVTNGRADKVIHCSSGNFRRHGDAILETDTAVFDRNLKTRIVRADFPALRDIAGLPEPEDDDNEVIDTPFPEARLHHPLLSGDATLERVAAGTLVLEATGGPVAGCAALHRAMNRLGADNASYRIDLGQGDRYLGYFGTKTSKALERLQRDEGLNPTGELDSATLLAIDAALLGRDTPGTSGGHGQSTAKHVRVSFDGNDWHATIDGETFPVGRRVSYQSRRGLANHYWSNRSAIYSPEEFAEEHGHWAWILQPSAQCESRGAFDCINSYDSARFTFGFYQFAAHTPNENFVLLLRRLLALESSREYFPDLSLKNGRIARETSTGVELLETTESTTPLQDYFNPGSADVEEIEAIQAAKLIYWSRQRDHQAAQVEAAVSKLKKAMPDYNRRYSLDGRLDSICLVVTDIRHQGRARSSEIIAALDAPNEDAALAALMNIGEHAYQDRIRTLESQVRRLTREGLLGRRRYDAGRNEFA